MRKWLDKYALWLLSGISLGLAGAAAHLDNMLAMAAFFGLFVFTAIAGVYFLNAQFTRELLTEYDNLVRVQRNRKGLKVIKGGKDEKPRTP